MSALVSFVGAGPGALTALIVKALLSVRPDLVRVVVA